MRYGPWSTGVYCQRCTVLCIRQLTAGVQPHLKTGSVYLPFLSLSISPFSFLSALLPSLPPLFSTSVTPMNLPHFLPSPPSFFLLKPDSCLGAVSFPGWSGQSLRPPNGFNALWGKNVPGMSDDSGVGEVYRRRNSVTSHIHNFGLSDTPIWLPTFATFHYY